jgi:hypothetical protein
MTPQTQQAVLKTIQSKGWDRRDALAKLQKSMAILEERNRKIAAQWLVALK